MKNLELKKTNLIELNSNELNEVNGGTVPPIVAYLAVGGTVVGILVAGALVGYGVYKLVDWMTGD